MSIIMLVNSKDVEEEIESKVDNYKCNRNFVHISNIITYSLNWCLINKAFLKNIKCVILKLILDSLKILL